MQFSKMFSSISNNSHNFPQNKMERTEHSVTNKKIENIYKIF